MSQDVLLVNKKGKQWHITINRPEQRNTINPELLSAFNKVLDEIERDDQCRMLVISGCDGYFCTGMDFEGLVTSRDNQVESSAEGDDYMNLLKRFASLSKIVVAKVDGTVMAGGVGLVAASDLVFATPRSTFSLSEALWGLLPACVTPFLIRRVGPHKAFRMTLTTETIKANDAREIGLVDKVTENLDEDVRRQFTRLVRLQDETISDVKSYFKKMWIFNEDMEQTAINELDKLMATQRVNNNIENYVKYERFPWE